MVVKIQSPGASTTATLVYNEHKMTAGEPEGAMTQQQEEQYLRDGATGHVVETRNVPRESTLENEFARLKMLNTRTSKGRKLENPSFHMSVNPGQGDAPMNEQQVVAFVDELMEQLGYGSNPYRIFRHDDTGRTHYHVVSTRIGQDGKKVRDSFENRRCEQVCKSLAAKYGFTYGLAEEGEEKEISERKETTPDDAPVYTPQTAQNSPRADAKQKDGREAVHGVDSPQNENTRKRRGKDEKKEDKKKREYIPPFEIGEGRSAIEQFRLFHNETMQWHFSTPEQYAAILRERFRVEATAWEDGYRYAGLDGKGHAVTAPMSEKEIGIEALDPVLKKCSEEQMSKRKAQRERVEKAAHECMVESKSRSEFMSRMRKKGIFTVVSYTKEGLPFGVTYLDRATRCAWKGSETQCNLIWLNEAARTNGWSLEAKLNMKGKEKELSGGQIDTRSLSRKDTLDGFIRERSRKRSGVVPLPAQQNVPGAGHVKDDDLLKRRDEDNDRGPDIKV